METKVSKIVVVVQKNKKFLKKILKSSFDI
jgi:hypothetical protein